MARGIFSDPIGVALLGFGAYMILSRIEQRVAVARPRPSSIPVNPKSLPTYPIGKTGTANNSWIQRALNQIFPNANLFVDGRIGPITRSYVIRFQEMWGLTPDGIVGAETEYALHSALGDPGYTNEGYSGWSPTYTGVPYYSGEY